MQGSAERSKFLFVVAHVGAIEVVVVGTATAAAGGRWLDVAEFDGQCQAAEIENIVERETRRLHLRRRKRKSA